MARKCGTFTVDETLQIIEFTSGLVQPLPRGSGSAQELRTDAIRSILDDDLVEVRIRLKWNEEQSGVASTSIECLRNGAWIPAELMLGSTLGREVTRRVRMPANCIRLRTKVTLTSGDTSTGEEYLVRVGRAPRFVTWVTMGGFCYAQDNPMGPYDPATEPTGTSGCPADLSIVPELSEIVANLECNDLCALDCTNFMKSFVNRMGRAGLCDEVQVLSDGGCKFSFESSIRNAVYLGKFRNSDREAFCRSDTTFESELIDLATLEQRVLLVVGQSLGAHHAGDTIRNNWVWGDRVTVPLFASWDGTSFLGSLTSVGDRPERVLNFYQRNDTEIVWWQKGDVISEAAASDRYDFTDCLSHNGLARSQFVHDTTFNALRDAIMSTRTAARATIP